MIRRVGTDGSIEWVDGQGRKLPPPGRGTPATTIRGAMAAARAPAKVRPGSSGRVEVPEGMRLLRTEVPGRFRLRDMANNVVFWFEHLAEYLEAKAADALGKLAEGEVWTPRPAEAAPAAAVDEKSGSSENSSTADGALQAPTIPPIVPQSFPAVRASAPLEQVGASEAATTSPPPVAELKAEPLEAPSLERTAQRMHHEEAVRLVEALLDGMWAAAGAPGGPVAVAAIDRLVELLLPPLLDRLGPELFARLGPDLLDRLRHLLHPHQVEAHAEPNGTPVPELVAPVTEPVTAPA